MAAIASYRRDQWIFDVDDSGGDGELVVLLHGFPQTRRMWDAVTPTLVAAGYRVIAPDQRGYSPGARPAARRDYALDELAADVVAIADTLGVERFHVVGHDWGGAVAWQLGATAGDRLHSCSVLATPHPTAMVSSLARSSQLLHSWYMLAFQPPWIPERFLRSRVGQRFLARQLGGSGLPPDEVAESQRLLRSGAAGPALNWYRALPFGAASGPGRVAVRTLYLYGARDFALGPTAARLTGKWVSGRYTFEVLPDAGHWLVEESPELVAAALVRNFSGDPVA